MTQTSHKNPRPSSFLGELFDTIHRSLIVSIPLLCLAGAAQAVDFDFADGELSGAFDTTIRYGATFRTGERNDNLASTGNLAGIPAPVVNRNDGNNNFNRGMVSSTVTLIPELDFTYKNFGGFVRGFAFYDEVISQNSTDGGRADQYSNNTLPGNVFPGETRDHAGSRAELLDAYVWGDFDLGSMPLNVRLGRQVVSWGESLFFQDGINQANPADLGSLRRPGAEIKDALIPIPMVYLQLGLTDSLTMEFYYKFRWEMSQADPAGTFLSSSDALIGKGTERALINLAGQAPSTVAGVIGFNALRGITDEFGRTVISTPKGLNQVADDSGQFGVAFRWFASNLNDTEFGVFYQNVHSAKPIAGVTTGGQGLAVADPASPFFGLNAFSYIESSSYYWIFPEDIETFGFSFNTSVGGVSLAGEIAFRPDSPFLAENGDNILTYNVLNAGALGVFGTEANFGPVIEQVLLEAGQADGLVGPNETVVNVLERDMFNFSLVALQTINNPWFADSLLIAAEVGAAYVSGLDDSLNYAATDAHSLLFIQSGGSYVQLPNSLGNADQFLDRWSWGYRVVLAPTFNNVKDGINLTPFLRLNHDVEGNSIVGGNFMESRKAATFGINANYLQNLTFGASMTWFTGAKDRNQLIDRDHANVFVNYAF